MKQATGINSGCISSFQSSCSVCVKLLYKAPPYGWPSGQTSPYWHTLNHKTMFEYKSNIKAKSFFIYLVDHITSLHYDEGSQYFVILVYRLTAKTLSKSFKHIVLVTSARFKFDKKLIKCQHSCDKISKHDTIHLWFPDKFRDTVLQQV